MYIEVRLSPCTARQWHLELLRRLSALPGTAAGLRLVDPRPRTPRAGDPDGDRLRAVMRTERTLHGLRARLAAHANADDLRPWLRPGRTPRVTDLALDLEGVGGPGGWQLTFDGHPGTDAAMAALAARRFPVAALADAEETVASARPGSEQPGLVTAALEDVLAGTLVLVEQAVAGNRLQVSGDGPVPAPSRPATVARTVAGAGLRRAYRAAYRAPHWRTGWRFVDDGAPGVLDELDLGGGWSAIPDDGRHFYADPFPVEVDGGHVLFVEDFDHRLGRGVISAVEVDRGGPLGTPRPVLEHRVHLSYPYVLRDEGAWWMIPETSAAGTVELYRATSFPAGWRRERILLDGVTASDVSVVRHEGRWWMFATVRHGGSWSDALHLWSADHLTGPWRPHPHNPVCLDIASARPAGRPVHHPDHRGGRLLRPVQDGSTGYGGGLAVAEVVRLDEEAYEQRVVGRLGPGPHWPGTRLHTLNRAGGLECIDGSARSPRFWR